LFCNMTHNSVSEHGHGDTTKWDSHTQQVPAWFMHSPAYPPRWGAFLSHPLFRDRTKRSVGW
jgi:hypothetical protein